MKVLAWGRLVAALLFVSLNLVTSPVYSNESEIVAFNKSLSGKMTDVWLRTAWAFDDLSELSGDKHFQIAKALEKSGFFLPAVISANPPYEEREEYWRQIEAKNELNCEAQKKAASNKSNAFGLPQLVICSGTNRNRVGEERIPRSIISFSTRVPSDTQKVDGDHKRFAVGTVDETRVISSERSTRPGCDWDALTRTWFTNASWPRAVQNAIITVTGRDSLDRFNCYFFDRDGVKWKTQRAVFE